MATLGIKNIGILVSGDLEKGIIDADSILCKDGLIARVGNSLDLGPADVVVDAKGTTVMPGLIDSHCHVVIGDFTPRQKTVDFLESYVHGGITSVISPGEIHAPGRPSSASGVKALAVAAHECFTNFHPLGMKCHAGSVIIEPTLSREDFHEVAGNGVWLAKYGFGAFADPSDGEPQIRWAQEAGLNVMCHSGGASIPGSKPITADHLMMLAPDVAGHINGGPTALTDEGVRRLVLESSMYLQVVQAGNLKKTFEIVNMAAESGALPRVIIGSDTPTGTGVMPLGVIKTVCEIASMTGLSPEKTLALAQGNNARAFNINQGVIEEGATADLVVLDAPWGSVGVNALEAIARGDIPGISAMILDGVVRTLRSRNTPTATRMAQVEPPMEWLNDGH